MPSAWSLLQTIKRPEQMTVMLRLSRISKTRRLSHIHLLIEKPIEKGILNINLLNVPLTR
jgi:hypothetical protein